MEDQVGTIAVQAADASGNQYKFRSQDVAWTSARFWEMCTLSIELWVDRLVTLAGGCRITTMSLVLQTPMVLYQQGQWVGLMQFRGQEVFTMVDLGDAVIQRPPDVFGYEVDAAVRHAAMCFGRGVALPGDILTLYVYEPTPAVRRWYRRIFVQSAPDDRLIQEAWHPGVHPVVVRGLSLLHRLTGGGSTDVLDRLLSVEVRCKTAEQDALVTQCRRAAGIVDVEGPMRRFDVTIQSHRSRWDFKWDNVSVVFGNERVFERPDERLRWLAIWICCTFSSRTGFESILHRTPNALLIALFPAIKRTMTFDSTNRSSHDKQASTIPRPRRCRGGRKSQKTKISGHRQ